MAKGDALYDNERSERRGGSEKVTETKKVTERRHAANDGKATKEPEDDEPPMKKKARDEIGEPEEPRNEKGQTQGEEREDPENGPNNEPEPAGKKDMFLDGLKGIQKRHERERADHANNYRELTRQMNSRHNKEIADHFGMHFLEEQGNGGAAAEETGSEAGKE